VFPGEDESKIDDEDDVSQCFVAIGGLDSEERLICFAL